MVDDRAEIVAVARGDVAPHHQPVLGLVMSPAGDRAVVLLGSGTDPEYGYQEICARIDGTWEALSGGNGCGHTSLSDDEGEWPDLDVQTDWAEAPEGARAAVIRYRGEEIEVPVANGFHLFADWDASGPEDAEFPETVRHLY